MYWRVLLSDLDYGQEEESAVWKVLHSKWLTMGAITHEFEIFGQTKGAKHAIAVSSANEALHFACLVLGIGPGEEVIIHRYHL